MTPQPENDRPSSMNWLRGVLPKKKDGTRGVFQALINYIMVPVFVVGIFNEVKERYYTNPYETVQVEIRVFDKTEGTDLTSVKFTFTDEEDTKPMELKRTTDAPYIYVGVIEVRRNTDTIQIQAKKRDFHPDSKPYSISIGDNPRIETSFMLKKKGVSRRFEEALKIEQQLF